MEDSGIDSDQRPIKGVGSPLIETPIMHSQDFEDDDEDAKSSSSESTAIKALKKSSEIRKTTELQKKLEKHRESTRKNSNHDSKRSILSRSRLVVPTKHEATLASDDHQPLVMIDTDDSEEEFTLHTLSKAAHREITQQLIKDGYNLDLEPDDEDLDLIPPRPLNERCVCCPGYDVSACSIQ